MAHQMMMVCDGPECEATVKVSSTLGDRDYWSQAPDKKWVRLEVRSKHQGLNTVGTKTFCGWQCVSRWAMMND